MSAPRLVIAVGNPSRGDDALGPQLLARLREAGVERGGRVELLEDFQLQPEHALDLDGREAVLIVDAAWPESTRDQGATAAPDPAVATPLPAASRAAGVRLQRIEPDPAASWTTHALRPQALLSIYTRVQGLAPPPAWLLSIEGQDFELGAPLSVVAQRHLVEALAQAQRWLRQA